MSLPTEKINALSVSLTDSGCASSDDNRIVKIVKNRASGYRNLDSFADMIYLTVGDLDIPAHIPSYLRTL